MGLTWYHRSHITPISSLTYARDLLNSVSLFKLISPHRAPATKTKHLLGENSRWWRRLYAILMYYAGDQRWRNQAMSCDFLLGRPTYKTDVTDRPRDTTWPLLLSLISPRSLHTDSTMKNCVAFALLMLCVASCHGIVWKDCGKLWNTLHSSVASSVLLPTIFVWSLWVEWLEQDNLILWLFYFIISVCYHLSFQVVMNSWMPASVPLKYCWDNIYMSWHNNRIIEYR